MKSNIPKKFLEQAQKVIAETPEWISRSGYAEGEPLDVESVATALAFIQCAGCKITRTASTGIGSYGAKHRAEHWGEFVGFAPYVANGDFIAACLYLGVPTNRSSNSGPNCTVWLTGFYLKGEEVMERARWRK